jgi:uncharacterized delta-60 repeat protein
MFRLPLGVAKGRRGRLCAASQHPGHLGKPGWLVLFAYAIHRVMGAAVLLSTIQAIGAPGDLDPTYGTDGITDPVITGGARGLAVQSDGKVVVVGYPATIARYTHEGELDTSFSDDGWHSIASTPERSYGFSSIGIQPDGKIVVGGVVNDSGGNFAVFRFDTNGELDTTFSNDGIVTTNASLVTHPGGSEVNAILIQPDGKIIAAGMSGSLGNMAVVRYLPNGNLDTSFAMNGIWIDGYQSSISSPNQFQTAALQPDGKIILAGTVNTSTFTGASDIGVCRLLNNGAFDTSFSGDGWVIWNVIAGNGFEAPKSLAIQQNGRIVVAGVAGDPSRNVMDYAVMRLTDDGSFDSTFSEDGKVVVPVDSIQGGAYTGNKGGPSCLIRPDGKILLGGWYRREGGGGTIYGLARLTSEGLLDSSFSGDGYAPAAPSSPLDSIYDIAVQPDGKVVAAILDGTFRVGRFTVDVDTDGDGADDPTEAAVGTNPLIRDTDGDGLEDGPELAVHGTDPLNPDTDGDGLTDGEEVNQYGSNPLLIDTDFDGISDFDEVRIHGTSPSRADTDGDGLSDYDEIFIHLTNPNVADTDGDGLSDGAEVNIHGTNPLNPDTDGDGFLDGYEVQTGKSPTDPANKPALVAEARTAIEFTFPTAIGKTYRIEASPDMTGWEAIEGNITGTGSAITRFYTTRNMPKRFLRVEEQTAP